jgi:L-alanine-DL-glutamate epimerase-like enolase superfamily enzyme
MEITGIEAIPIAIGVRSLEDGAMAVPDEPGLGVTVEEDAVEAYRID